MKPFTVSILVIVLCFLLTMVFKAKMFALCFALVVLLALGWAAWVFNSTRKSRKKDGL